MNEHSTIRFVHPDLRFAKVKTQVMDMLAHTFDHPQSAADSIALRRTINSRLAHDTPAPHCHVHRAIAPRQLQEFVLVQVVPARPVPVQPSL